MRSILLTIAALLLVACDTNQPRPVSQNSNSAPVADRPQTAIAHSSEKQTPPASNAKGGAWSQSGEAFDTSSLDKAVADAEKALNAKPSDESARKTLAKAYFERAVALTDKRQYASALGDYRRTIKNDPANSEAKDWIDKIVMIYDSLGRSAPAEGQEPPPLPFKKS